MGEREEPVPPRHIELALPGLDGVRDRMTAVRDAKLTVIEGAGHMLHHDRPEAVARVVESFLDAP